MRKLSNQAPGTPAKRQPNGGLPAGARGPVAAAVAVVAPPGHARTAVPVSAAVTTAVPQDCAEVVAAHLARHGPFAEVPGYLGFIARPELSRLTCLGKSAVYEAMKDETSGFPKSYRLGRRRVGWKLSEVMAWINSRPLNGAEAQ